MSALCFRGVGGGNIQGVAPPSSLALGGIYPHPLLFQVSAPPPPRAEGRGKVYSAVRLPRIPKNKSAGLSKDGVRRKMHASVVVDSFHLVWGAVKGVT